jgi:hypothetical protein
MKCARELIDIPEPVAARAKYVLENVCLVNPFTERLIRSYGAPAGRTLRVSSNEVMIVNEWSRLEQLFPMQGEIHRNIACPLRVTSAAS